MNQRLLALALFAAVIAAVLAGTARTEEEEGGDEMAAWMALGKPGPEHAWLAKLAGSWTVEAHFFDGSGASQTSHGKSTISAVWEGRYLEQKYEGTFMGQPFEGRGMWAYNNGAKRFEGTWIDSASSSIAYSTGERADDTLTMRGTMTSPMGEVKTRDVVKVSGPDNWTMESYWTAPQGEMKVMELVYTRANAGK